MTKTFIGVVFLIASIALWFLYVRPQWQHYGDISQEIQDLSAISQEFDDLSKNRDTVLSSMTSISPENLNRADAALPNGAHASEFLVSLEGYTLGSGVSLKQVDLASPSEEKKSENTVTAAPTQSSRSSQPKPTGTNVGSVSTKKSVGELPFSIHIAGSYDAVKKFIAAVERNIRLIDVQDVSFTAGEKVTDVMDVTIKAKTYYQ